jgi:hypothetical protein
MIEPVEAAMTLYRVRCDGCGFERDGFSVSREAALKIAESEDWHSAQSDGKAEIWCAACLDRMAREVP